MDMTEHETCAWCARPSNKPHRPNCPRPGEVFTATDLRNARAEATAAAEQRLEEVVAKAIYDDMRARDSEGRNKPWVPGGNSLKQDEARRRARTALLDTPSPASPRQGEEDRPARCAEEGCVRTPGHVGAHTSRPYWPRELRDELALEPFTKVVVGIYDPATKQTETIVGDSASPRQEEPVGLDVARLTTVFYDWMPDGADVAVGFDGEGIHLTGGDLARYIFDRAAEAAALSEPAEAEQKETS